MKRHNLQAILDKAILENKDLLRSAQELIKGGARFIQLRDKVSSDKIFFKEARAVRSIAKENGSILIINDRVDIAMAVNANGVHLGQEDMPYEQARKLLGKDKIIGISAHSMEEALEAQKRGADYIGIGPIFKTNTKPALDGIGPFIVSEISEGIRIPSFFIGGINLSNIDEIIKRGGRSVAIASAILNESDIAKSAKTFIERLKAASLRPAA